MTNPIQTEGLTAGGVPERLEWVKSALEALETLVAKSSHPYKDGLAAVVKRAVQSPTKPEGTFDTSDYVIVGHDGVPRRNPTKPEGLEWIRSANAALDAVEAESECKFSPDFDIGRIDETDALPSFRIKVGHIRSLLSPVSDATDTVPVTREDAKLILTYAGYVHPGANTDKAAFDRLRARLNGGAL